MSCLIDCVRAGVGWGGVKSRIIKRVDEQYEAPMRELMQELRATRNALAAASLERLLVPQTVVIDHGPTSTSVGTASSQAVS